MITDIFARRYAGVQIRDQFYQDDHRFMTQAAVMIMDPLWLGFETDKVSEKTESALKAVHDTLALELGREVLSEKFWFSTYTLAGNQHTAAHTNSYATMCKAFLTKPPEDFSKGDIWVKERMSLVELAFRARWIQIQEANLRFPVELAKASVESPPFGTGGGIRLPGNRADGIRAANERINAAFDESVRDLNERMRLALYKLTYHSGLIQLAEDEAINTQVAKPFWSLVAGPQWANVDEQIKEAIDRRDNGDRTAAFHAVCALESTIKIICDLKGWTTGAEKGAANYIDHLNSKSNGRFIDVWEAETLKGMFSDVRNPFAHGPGQAPMPKLTPHQTDWAIDTAMSWIRNLIRRL